MSNDLNTVKYVTIGQGRSVHVAHVFTYSGSGNQQLAAKCDQSGFANITSGRKVRAVDADAATCKRCIKIVESETPVVDEPVVEQSDDTCDACHVRPAGFGHFALYCEPCSKLPYGQSAPAVFLTHAGDDCLSYAPEDQIVSGDELPTCGDCREAVLRGDYFVSERDAQLIELSERDTMLRDVRDVYGDEAAELVANGWTVDSALSHVEGTCDRELCTGEHGERTLTLSITCSGAAFGDAHSDDERVELSRLLDTLRSKIDDGAQDGSLFDINGQRVGSFRFEKRES